MAVLYISEYADLPLFNGQIIPTGQEPSVAEQNVAIGVASAQSAAFDGNTKFVLVHTDAICSIKFGANPTAVATEARMAAGETRFYGVKPGDKVAVIQNT